MRRDLMVFVWAVVCLLSVSSVAAVSRSEGRLKASLQARAKSPVDIFIDEPHPKADMFFRIKEEVGRIENKDFTEGKIYSTAEKIQEYKKILSTTIDELRSLQDAIDWHEVHKNGTQQALKDAVSTYEKSHHRIKLLEATAKLLAKEVNELKFYREQAEKTNSSAQRDLNLMKYELASLNSSARARSRIDANAAVEEAARKVSSSYQNLVLGLKTVASTLGKNFTIDESNVEGFAEHVANLQKELSELDRQAGDMRNRAVEDVQKLVGDIKNQENREGSVTKIEEDIEKEKKEVAKYQELYDKVKVEYEK